MAEFVIDLTCLRTVYTQSMNGAKFTVEREDLGTFDVNEKDFSRPGRQISKDALFVATPVSSLEHKVQGMACIWDEVVVPTEALNEADCVDDIITELKEKSQSDHDEIQNAILDTYEHGVDFEELSGILDIKTAKPRIIH